jgi:hypothetical protein
MRRGGRAEVFAGQPRDSAGGEVGVPFVEAASNGAKKSVALSEPSAWTFRRTTDSPRLDGGFVPGAGGGAPPLPVLSRMFPEPSEVSPAPDCQMPAPSPDATETQRALIAPAVETPNTHPCQGGTSQWEPKAA